MHQLLPTYPCVDDGTGSLKRISEAAGLPRRRRPDEARRGQGVPRRDRRPRWTRNGGYGRYQICPVAGIFQPTRQSAVVRDETVEILQTLDGEDIGGDGTVPRASATPLELSDDATRGLCHRGARVPAELRPGARPGAGHPLARESLAEYKASPADGFRLEVDDVVPPHEPVELTLATGGPVRNVETTAENVDTGATFTATAQIGGDGRATLALPPLEPGVYRLVGRETDGVGIVPVHDLIVVGDDESANVAAEQAEPRATSRGREQKTMDTNDTDTDEVQPIEPPADHDCEDAPEGAIARGDSAADRGWGPGWPTDNSSKLKVVRTAGIAVSVRAEMAPLVKWLLDETVRKGYKPRNGECWGFANRPIRGTQIPSNHSWGLAVDLNAPANPMTDHLVTDMPAWMPKLWKSKQFRWGGDYKSRKDAMHYEFMGTPEDAVRLSKEVGGSTTATAAAAPGDARPLLKRKAKGDAVRLLQERLNANGFKLETDGIFGKDTDAAVREFQKAKGLTVDGKVGKNTWAALG